jgi:hypothetical protein
VFSKTEKNITGITVCSNTKELVKRAYESVRTFHPMMRIIIIDGSDKLDPCFQYVSSLASEKTIVIQPGYNIGHGRGMCVGIYYAETPYALIFDSDIEMKKSPVQGMLVMMEDDTFGVGFFEKTGFDGFNYGVHQHHLQEPGVKYLHPYFQLLQIKNYKKFHPYVHHGAPCFLTMNDIHRKGLSDKILKEFPGLGHTRDGVYRKYIRHDVAGTRIKRINNNQIEIEGRWNSGFGGNKMITCLTITGDRPETFELCRMWMEHQTRKPDQWLVIDDGFIPISKKSQTGMEYIRRNPSEGEGHTLIANLTMALPYIKGDKILIVEDDDWYGPEYIRTMAYYLNTYDLVGEGAARYYFAPLMLFRRLHNANHASFCQTGFTRKILPILEKCLPGNPYVDARLWEAVENNKHIFMDESDKLHLHCSLKGLKGRKGIGDGHNANAGNIFYQVDNGLNQLIAWVGEENARIYMEHVGQSFEGARLIQTEVVTPQKTKEGKPELPPQRVVVAHPHPGVVVKRANVRSSIRPKVSQPKPVRIGNRILPPDWR